MSGPIRSGFIAALMLAAAGGASAQEARSMVSDLMTKGRSAFNDLKYKQADSLARRVLSYSVLLTPQQKTEAMQLVVAATYPEEEAEQKADVAIDFIKQLLATGATGIPRELSWPGLDSLYVWVQRASAGTVAQGSTPAAPVAPPAAPTGPAEVRLGSPVAEAFLYLNGRIVGPITTAQWWKIPGGENVKLEIKSPKCGAPWDTTINVAPGAQVTIGRRLPKGCQ